MSPLNHEAMTDCSIIAAAIYLNQKGVGQGIKEGLKRANLKRSDIWVTTKLWDDMLVGFL